jgi:preprotein translocase subunit YajC
MRKHSHASPLFLILAILGLAWLFRLIYPNSKRAKSRGH